MGEVSTGAASGNAIVAADGATAPQVILRTNGANRVVVDGANIDMKLPMTFTGTTTTLSGGENTHDASGDQAIVLSAVAATLSLTNTATGQLIWIENNDGGAVQITCGSSIVDIPDGEATFVM